ncbi:COX15/CtaA family protein [Stratiformator vulcanicus]|uniref:Cytochrome oxidase assembly protein n=1 Tax=Stratiformator vulcanicus TaxID=2527980 RepID=A0A517R3U7_9PLAN|nr:COX15/CtaA family protein [Stratiformator vulcanicus]QDT38562.1 Cytochrome oxidase assembly protein [Stratiformator vulcanicus]
MSANVTEIAPNQFRVVDATPAVDHNAGARAILSSPPVPVRMRYKAWNHWIAVLTVVTSLLPITVGVLTTTFDAGMAFLDWPTSDQQNMFLYDMLSDIREGRTDKVLEHGHRLAGALLGVVSILLAGVLFVRDERVWVKRLGILVLLGVIVQGLIGGFRVRLDERFLALFHGTFGAIVFSAICLAALVTSRRWLSYRVPITDSRPRGLMPVLVIIPVAIVVQYSLGGMVRHLGLGLYEHLGMAAVVWLLANIGAALSIRTGEKFLISNGYLLAAAATMQVALGFGAWIVKFGWKAQGYVAVQNSAEQVLFRSGHTVVGMVLLAAAVCLLAKAVKLSRLGWKPAEREYSNHFDVGGEPAGTSGGKLA